MFPVLPQARTWSLALTALISFSIWGCTAQLENPEAFSDRTPASAGAASAGAASSSAGAGGAGVGGNASGGSAGNGGAGFGGSAGSGGSAGAGGIGGSSAGSTGLPACVSALFVNNTGKCAAAVCHAKGSSPAANLDLGSPGVEMRLLDQTAQHQGLDAGSTCSTSDKLIDSSDPSKSWLLKKITGQQGNCGARMPLGQSLTPAELTCLQTWIQSY